MRTWRSAIERELIWGDEVERGQLRRDIEKRAVCWNEWRGVYLKGQCSGLNKDGEWRRDIAHGSVVA